MDDKKTKVNCRLMIRGTDKANARAIDDLQVNDPDPAVGKQVIKDAIDEGSDNDDESSDS